METLKPLRSTFKKNYNRINKIVDIIKYFNNYSDNQPVYEYVCKQDKVQQINISDVDMLKAELYNLWYDRGMQNYIWDKHLMGLGVMDSISACASPLSNEVNNILNN